MAKGNSTWSKVEYAFDMEIFSRISLLMAMNSRLSKQSIPSVRLVLFIPYQFATKIV